jgi:hypothetical protein
MRAAGSAGRAPGPSTASRFLCAFQQRVRKRQPRRRIGWGLEQEVIRLLEDNPLPACRADSAVSDRDPRRATPAVLGVHVGPRRAPCRAPSPRSCRGTMTATRSENVFGRTEEVCAPMKHVGEPEFPSGAARQGSRPVPEIRDVESRAQARRERSSWGFHATCPRVPKPIRCRCPPENSVRNSVAVLGTPMADL